MTKYSDRNCSPGVSTIYILNIILNLLLVIPAFAQTEFLPGRAGFAIRIKDVASPYNIMSTFVTPNESFLVEIEKKYRQGEFAIEAPGLSINTQSPYKWSLKAPAEKGLYVAKITSKETADSMTLNVFVIFPLSEMKGEYLNSYRVGKYPKFPLKQLPIYKPPPSLLEVTEENLDTWITPHFQLKQFICKQEGNFPKYLILREKLLLKLEFILEKVNERGYACQSFNIMSGYRTPYYNHLIGNVKYSRHLWGGAADIYIDENPRDEMMDDLNKDGIINWKDAAVLYDIIDDLYKYSFYEQLAGGLARYKKTKDHGPFVHVDVRGRRARWGD